MSKRRSSNDQLIGMRIRECRKMLGLTQRQLAELLGVTYQQVHKYEHGKNGLSAGQLFELARGAGTPVEYFFEGLEANDGQPLPLQRRLLDVMGSLGEMQNEGQKAAIGHLIRSLAG